MDVLWDGVIFVQSCNPYHRDVGTPMSNNGAMGRLFEHVSGNVLIRSEFVGEKAAIHRRSRCHSVTPLR